MRRSFGVTILYDGGWIGYNKVEYKEVDYFLIIIQGDNNMMTGNEKFTSNGHELDFSMLDYWRYKYSQIYDLQDTIAEFIVEKALGLEKSYNTDYWTLFDVEYRNTRIEIKETSYYHAFNTDGNISKQRAFGITKAYSEYKNPDSVFERQNDIYVFCLNIGNDKESSNPLKMENWEFYIVPTSIINEKCKDNKTISLGVVRELSRKFAYEEIKEEIDRIIDEKK